MYSIGIATRNLCIPHAGDRAYVPLFRSFPRGKPFVERCTGIEAVSDDTRDPSRPRTRQVKAMVKKRMALTELGEWEGRR